MKVYFERFRHSLANRGLPELLALAARILGAVFLVIAALSPWFLAPSDVPPGALEPGITWLFRALCLLVAITPRTRKYAAALLLAVLLYPSLVLHTSPGIVARSTWLGNQHEQLSEYAGDIYASQENRDAGWQQRIVVVNRPLENRIFKLPAWSPANLEWGRFFEVMEWLGLSSWFAQALARGWVLALAGAALLLASRARELSFSARPLAIAAGVFALATLPFFASAYFLNRARDLVRSGDYERALTALDRAAAALPAIREDGVFFLQIGRLESELGRRTPAAEFYRAQRLAEDGFTQQAQTAMLAALGHAEPGSVWQRELVKGLLTRAINELNSGQTNPAIALLEPILAADPCNLKANYALQIACVRAGHLEELRLLAARMRETYRFLNTPTKRSVLAAAQEHLAFAELQDGSPAQALAHWRNSKPHAP